MRPNCAIFERPWVGDKISAKVDQIFGNFSGYLKNITIKHKLLQIPLGNFWKRLNYFLLYLLVTVGGGGAIAQLISVCLRSCSPRFESQAQHLRYDLNCNMKLDENQTKRGRDWPIFRKNFWSQWCRQIVHISFIHVRQIYLEKISSIPILPNLPSLGVSNRV